MFKVGDYVIISNEKNFFYGCRGVIEEVRDLLKFPYRVRIIRKGFRRSSYGFSGYDIKLIHTKKLIKII